MINFYQNIKTIYCDNEASFNSETITSLLKNQYSIDLVERFLSTLAEIGRFLKLDCKN